ncbi:MAG: DUF4177 domain-containing protein [Phycisphaerae bacterium]
MQKWEYTTLGITGSRMVTPGGQIDPVALLDALTRAGGQGWEVCGVIDTTRSDGVIKDAIVLMKRPLVG